MSTDAKTTPLDFNPFDPNFRADPHPIYPLLLSRSPAYIDIDGIRSIVVARPEHISEVIRDPQRFHNAKPKLPGLEKVDFFNGMPVMPYSDPPVHTKLRIMVAPAFAPKAMQEFSEAGITEINRLLDLLIGKEKFDLVPEVSHKVPLHLILDTLLHVPKEDWHVFTDISDSHSDLAQTLAGQPKPDSFVRAWQAGIDYCQKLISDRTKHPSDDLVGKIIAQGEAGTLNSEELLAMLLLLFTAGLNTVSTFLSAAFILLLRHPDQLQLLREQPELVNNAVEEVLRYDAPNTATWRFAACDTEVAGLQVSAGMPIYIMNGAANFDEGRYEDPFRFDITRKPSRHIAFGEGIHNCLGAPMARLIGKQVLNGLLQRFPHLRFESADFMPEYAGTPTVRRVCSVPLVTVPRG